MMLTLALAACQPKNSPPQAVAPAVDAQQVQQRVAEYKTELQTLLSGYRQIIVLVAGDATLSANDRSVVNQVGQTIFHQNLDRGAKLNESLGTLFTARDAGRFDVSDALLDYIESDPDLFDADRLAFRDTLNGLSSTVATDSTLPAVKLHQRITEDLGALDAIEREYDTELKAIFSRFETRAIQLKRERWDDYVNKLRGTYTREQILKQYATVLPYPEPVDAHKGEERRLYGYNLPPKTLALTFDDGPHPQYTDEIAAILKQYNVPGVFFEVGQNLGTIGKDNHISVSARAKVTRNLLDQGFVVGNHSYSHAQLSKETGNPLQLEIVGTDDLLKAVDPRRSTLFRFPYGADNDEGLKLVSSRQMQTVMWNIDSMDWADPVPDSIVQRVLDTVNEEKRGIVLFHDIHERTVKALPKILERLSAEGYRFAGWDGKQFVAAEPSDAELAHFSVSADYGDSWAVVIGIDDYNKWPKLQYATRDAEAVRDEMIQHFGFNSDHVFTLLNGQATRSAILNVFHEHFAHEAAGKSDRLFVFFAGHGATRSLSSGRTLGYIIPADSNPDQFESDAIPMTELQNISESITPKHAFFVMDACYSGLGLARGSADRFLKDNAKRQGRQMLTAGGADQMVADGGPDGHSVFTWTLLQALSGKGDLNGDGLMTATELAAYIGPAVASISQQTPAFGSLPGSQGGEFVLERRAEVEFLEGSSPQLAAAAVEMNQKLAAAQPSTSTIKLKDLQGKEQTLKLPKAVNSTSRQLAQRANDRGLQLYREQQYDDAEVAFTEALKLRPDFALAANNLGFIFSKRGQYDVAVRWYEKTIAIDPSRAVAYLNLGDALAQAGQTERAKTAYKTYLELSPDSKEAARVNEKLNGT
ncbi:MAG: polysaccharide deacetylase family protein [Steroidobacteraceae bacterium]